MSTVLRRLYNVAYGKVRLWREGDPEGEVELESSVRRPPPPDLEPEEEPAPRDADPPPAPTLPLSGQPRQRRL